MKHHVKAKIYSEYDGSVHWVRASDVETLLDSKMYRADQRYHSADRGERKKDGNDAGRDDRRPRPSKDRRFSTKC